MGAGMRKEIEAVAVARSCWGEKFGAPRQAGVVPEAWGRVVFEPAFRKAEAVRRLEGFSHLWLLWGFHLSEEEGVGLTARPPRLGGNERVGVFASRSPFRPNGLGLSVVRLEAVVMDGGEAPFLEVSGLDLVDGTPVYDIKPYIPCSDAVPGARGGYAADPWEELPVTVAEGAREDFAALPQRTRALVLSALSRDPRPAIHRGAAEFAGREYGSLFAGVNVRWRAAGKGLEVLGVEEQGGFTARC